MTSAQAMARVRELVIRPAPPLRKNVLTRFSFKQHLRSRRMWNFAAMVRAWLIFAASGRKLAGSNWPINKSRIFAHRVCRAVMGIAPTPDLAFLAARGAQPSAVVYDPGAFTSCLPIETLEPPEESSADFARLGNSPRRRISCPAKNGNHRAPWTRRRKPCGARSPDATSACSAWFARCRNMPRPLISTARSKPLSRSCFCCGAFWMGYANGCGPFIAWRKAWCFVCRWRMVRAMNALSASLFRRLRWRCFSAFSIPILENLQLANRPIGVRLSIQADASGEGSTPALRKCSSGSQSIRRNARKIEGISRQ